VKAFGEKSTAAEQGFDLQTITGWLEDMIQDEEERGHPLVAKAYDALQLLTEIADGVAGDTQRAKAAKTRWKRTKKKDRSAEMRRIALIRHAKTKKATGPQNNPNHQRADER
jgi:hypothetical protein